MQARPCINHLGGKKGKKGKMEGKKDRKLGKEGKLEKIRRNQRPSPSIVSQKPPISTLVRPMLVVG